MNDQPNVVVDANRPEVRISWPVEPMKAETRTGRVQLEIERRRLDGLLLCTGQPGETGGEGIGDAEIHPLAASRYRQFAAEPFLFLKTVCIGILLVGNLGQFLACGEDPHLDTAHNLTWPKRMNSLSLNGREDNECQSGSYRRVGARPRVKESHSCDHLSAVPDTDLCVLLPELPVSE
jgi:hypothetical protein